MTEITGSSLSVFIALTVVLAGGAAMMTGKALARTWRPPWQVVFASLGLGLADRFFIYALFDGPLLSLQGYLFDTLIITVMALIAYRLAHVDKMVQQYPWIYERAGPWAYREKIPAAGEGSS